MSWQNAEAIAQLERALAYINSAGGGDTAALLAALDVVLEFPATRLAAYGTLMPGESNHALLADVRGTWVAGTVRGVRFTADGFPAFHWRHGQGQVPVQVLTSAALPEQWRRLDDFEGEDYRRILVPVTLASSALQVANLYEYQGPRASRKQAGPLPPRPLEGS
jgi:gamma-glutamylcyclotransferase (GGCT)/AIG2-like uncharacterized protein YtfP